MTWEEKVRGVDEVLMALRPLAKEERAPAVVLLENVPDFLRGAYDLLCAELVYRFGDLYQWEVCVACPSVVAGSPQSRARVYILGLKRTTLLEEGRR